MPVLTINRRQYSVEAPNDTPLLWIIREELQMTGTKIRLRRRTLRRLHRSFGRRGRPLLPDVIGQRRGQENHHH
jgi:hypothetical protein